MRKSNIHHAAKGGEEVYKGGEFMAKDAIPIIYAKDDITLNRSEAIDKTISLIRKMGGFLIIGNKPYSVSKSALNKMTAQHGEAGIDKAYQKERIAAIQSLSELTQVAVTTIKRSDDGRDVRVQHVVEFHAPFCFDGNVYRVRLLAKEFTELAKENEKTLVDKLHSMKIEDIIIKKIGSVTEGVHAAQEGHLANFGIKPIRTSDIDFASTPSTVTLRQLFKDVNYKNLEKAYKIIAK